MFQEFFGFAQLPFSRTIATSDLFPTAGQKELAARLNYLVRERGFGLVTGAQAFQAILQVYCAVVRHEWSASLPECTP